MGFLDGILSSLSSGSKEESQTSSVKVPFKVSTSFRPVRLRAMSQNSCDLILELTNCDSRVHMCSIVVDVPNALGFDSMGLHKKKELRLGNLEAGQKRQISVPINATNQTPAGNYRMFITVYSHYRDYSHVLNSIRKSVDLRVV